MLSKLGSYRFKVVWTTLLFALLLAACGSGSLPAAPTNTPTPASGGGETAGNAQNPAPEVPADAEIGLIDPPLAPPPPDTLPPMEHHYPAPQGSGRTGAMLVIRGGMPLVLTGGECERLGNESYVNIPSSSQVLSSGTIVTTYPNASLVIYEGTGNIRSGTLVWALSEADTDHAVVSTQDFFAITLNGDGFSGSFEGTARRVTAGVPVTDLIEVWGVFTCVPGLFAVGGEHPMELTHTRCNLEPFRIEVGQRGENAGLLLLEDGVGPGESGRGGLSWRVDGINYVSDWLTLTRYPDGLSGSYFGIAAGPDGIRFPVQGTFNCLGT